MQYIFTNFQLLIIGFGLSDPDFDMLLQNAFSVFGSPIQEHIVIKHESEKMPKDTLYRLRYGLNFLYVKDYRDIPVILRESTRNPGHVLEQILKECIDSEYDIRHSAHLQVRRLNDIGMKCLANILEEKIMEKIAHEKETNYSSDDNTITSEYVYTYGLIAVASRKNEYKNFLINEVIYKSLYSEPIAHALYNIRDVMLTQEIGLAKHWMDSFRDRKYKEDPKNPNLDNKVYAYCEIIYYSLNARKKIIDK